MSKTEFRLRDKIAELEKLEAYFEKPEMDLEEAIQKHTEALVLAKEITAYLEKAESSLKQLEIGTGTVE